MFLKIKAVGGKKYLYLIKTYRDENGKVKQKFLHSFGNYDKLRVSGELAKLRANFAKVAFQFDPLNIQDDDNVSVQAYAVGPAQVFQRLWEQLGIAEIFAGLLQNRKFKFSIERAVFLEVLHRLFSSGSDRDAMSWREDYEIPGTCEIVLHHLYRAMKFLGENKNKIEEQLFAQNRDLFNHTVDLVFFDTTSLYFESEKETNLKKRGHSKDNRRDALQVVFGVLLDKDGRPIACEILPGNTADVTTVKPLIERLQKRFKIRRVVFVGDRGFTSNENLEAFEKIKFEYIAGVKMRNTRDAREIVLSQANDFNNVAENLQVQEIFINNRRYIVCFNPEQAERDAHVREELIQSLEAALQQGSKRLVSNKGYRKYARIEKDAISIDEEKIASEEIYDGIWILRTNTDLPAADVTLQYKRQTRSAFYLATLPSATFDFLLSFNGWKIRRKLASWQVEQFFRNTKCMLDTRPIYHQNDKHIVGHIFISFLALLLRYELYQRLEEKKIADEKNKPFPWSSIIASLNRLKRIVIAEKDYVAHWRTDADSLCSSIFKALNLRLPRRYQEVT